MGQLQGRPLEEPQQIPQNVRKLLLAFVQCPHAGGHYGPGAIKIQAIVRGENRQNAGRHRIHTHSNPEQTAIEDDGDSLA
jgi:hypothetical protein